MDHRRRLVEIVTAVERMLVADAEDEQPATAIAACTHILSGGIERTIIV